MKKRREGQDGLETAGRVSEGEKEGGKEGEKIVRGRGREGVAYYTSGSVDTGQIAHGLFHGKGK